MKEQATRSVFRFIRYIVNDSVIKIKEGDVANDFKMSLNLYAEVYDGTNVSKLELAIDVSDANQVIIAHVVMTGYFESINCDEAQRNAFLCHNAPAILFPYMRAYISCVTAQSGMSPVIIPTVNLRKEGENLLTQISKTSEV